MDEIEAMKAISEKLDKLSGEERSRVVNWTVAKYGVCLATPPSPSMPPQPPANTSKPTSAKATSKPKSTKKAKSIISLDKGLNLSPSGKKTADDFANEKAPGSGMQKGVVAVYYLRDFVGLEKITVSAVYTFFKTVGWPVPADLRNTLQQAGSQGWLDTSDGDNIKLTSMGENLVEHSLPSKKG